MRITYRTDYALKTVLGLALNYGNSPMTINQLAKRADIPMKFLEQILLDLKKGGFVESRRGKVGGYLLAKPPAEIKLGQVIRFVEGNIEPIACVDNNYKGCSDIRMCVFKNIWQKVSEATSKIVNQVTFADLVRTYKQKNRAAINMYYI